MDQKNMYVMFDLIKSAIFDVKIPNEKIPELTEDDKKEIIVESKKHDSLHLVSYGLYINGLLDPQSKFFERAQQIQATAMYRCSLIELVLEKVCTGFEDEKISFMPLKGSVIREHYREGWLRTSSDIDILVKNDDVDRAISFLTDKCGFTYHHKDVYDHSLFSPEGVHLELHFNLIGDYVSDESFKVAKRVWETAELTEGYNYWYRMSDEMFYYFHITHMAKHFVTGGCGIKPFIDMLILEKMGMGNAEKREALLVEGKLIKFEQNAKKLYKVWFWGDEHTETTRQMQEYVLFGGVYGNKEAKIKINLNKRGGKIKYIFSRIFMPYSLMKWKYPILEKHKYLFPLYSVRRWFEFFSKERRQRSMQEFEVCTSVSEEQANTLQACLRELGL